MVKVILTKSALISLNPCDLSQRLALFGDKSRLTVRQALALGVSVGDILWVAGALGLGVECLDFAQNCAERAARYASYVASYARDAGYASDAAALATRYAGYASDAARDAARWAADSADRAARYASYAARDARWAAGYAARYASDTARDARWPELREQRADLIKIFG